MTDCIKNSKEVMEDLRKPFELHEIKWRVQVAVEKKDRTGYRILVVPYITSRTVSNRLDNVCGGFWQSHFDKIEVNGQVAFQCRLSIKIGDEWITRTDASEVSEFDSVKGGHSNSLKRAGAQWGIGRYIYELRNLWVDVQQRGEHYFSGNFKVNGREQYISGYYDTPSIPDSALPFQNGNQEMENYQTNNQQVPNLQKSDHSTLATKSEKELDLEALRLVRSNLQFLNVPQELIPVLLEHSSGSKVDLEQVSRKGLGMLYRVLEPVSQYVKACKKYELDERGMIYFAQIVLRVELENIYSLFFKMDKEISEAAILLMKEDMKKNQVG